MQIISLANYKSLCRNKRTGHPCGLAEKNSPTPESAPLWIVGTMSKGAQKI
jgi:hypothetical protein